MTDPELLKAFEDGLAEEMKGIIKHGREVLACAEDGPPMAQAIANCVIPYGYHLHRSLNVIHELVGVLRQEAEEEAYRA